MAQITDTNISGGVMTPKTLNPPSQCIGNDAVKNSASNPIDSEKVEQQHAIMYRQKTGTAVVADTDDIYIVRGTTGELLGVDVTVTTAPTGADRTINVDVQKSTGGGAFASMLTGTVLVNNTTVAKAIQAGALVATPTLVDGDILRIVVTVAGAAGAQGQGLLVTLAVREKADP